MIVVLFAWPACASAAIHTGHVRFLEPRTPPSIGVPGPPADEVAEYEREVLVRYDAGSGTITLEVEVWDPAFWGETLLDTGGQPAIRPVDFAVGPNCGSTPLEGSVEATPKVPAVAPQPVEGEPWRETEGTPASGGTEGEATLHGYGGHVHSTGTFDGQRFTFTFTDPEFRGRDWRCVSLGEHLTFKLGEWPKTRR
jgi:hypothetical protein